MRDDKMRSTTNETGTARKKIVTQSSGWTHKFMAWIIRLIRGK